MANEAEIAAEAARDRYEKSWKGRAERHTRGNETRLGAILICVLGRKPLRPPMFEGLAVIDTRGIVHCTFINKNGYRLPMMPAMEVVDLVREFNTLADQLKLTDDERKEMFTELRKWIVRDRRAKSDENTF